MNTWQEIQFGIGLIGAVVCFSYAVVLECQIQRERRAEWDQRQRDAGPNYKQQQARGESRPTNGPTKLD